MVYSQLGEWILALGCIGALLLAGIALVTLALAAIRTMEHFGRTSAAAEAIVDRARARADIARLRAALLGCSVQLARLQRVSAHLSAVLAGVIRILAALGAITVAR